MVIAGRCIQGASGATILACGLSLLTVGTPEEGKLRAVSLWGAAAGVGAAAGPLLGGVLVELTTWQGLFWVDAGVAAVCMAMTAAKVTESRDEDRPRSIDIAGSVLVALVLTPIILALSEGSDWGWTSLATLGCVALAIASAFAFVAVEKRVAVPMLDLALLRNRILVASTIAILIGAGTINALMYLVSLYFQDPSTLGLSALQAGLATLPATAGLVAVAPFVPKVAAKFGGRQIVGAGFALTAVGFAWIGFVDGSWRYAAFVLPLIAVAVGMGLSNGPATSASTACVAPAQVGAASGVSNMARYVGAAVATALAATIYGNVIASKTAEGQSSVDALSSGLATASWVMAVFSLAGVAMAVVMGRHTCCPRHARRLGRSRGRPHPHPADLGHAYVIVASKWAHSGPARARAAARRAAHRPSAAGHRVDADRDGEDQRDILPLGELDAVGVPGAEPLLGHCRDRVAVTLISYSCWTMLPWAFRSSPPSTSMM